MTSTPTENFGKTFTGFKPEPLKAMVDLFGDKVLDYSIEGGWFYVEFPSRDSFINFLTNAIGETIYSLIPKK